MPVEHMVWIKFNPGVDASRMQEHMDGLASLRDHVPGILDLKLGENFTNRSEGFTHGLIVTLEDKAALEGYRKHPKHVEVAGALVADAKLLVMDFVYPPEPTV